MLHVNMAQPHYGKIALKGWKKIMFFGIVAMVAAAGLSFLETLKYSSQIRMLIIQPAALNVDPYTAIRSAEQIGNNLAQVVYTTDFFQKVTGASNASFVIDPTYFPDNDAKRRKKWIQTVSVKVENGTGLLNITVYHPNKEQATSIARAIAYVMTTEGANYVGGTALQIRLVDEPLVSRFPVKPNIPVNGFTGLILGALFGIAYVILTDKSRKYLVEHPPTFV
jgi:capsular polysaccharide biosynthesis protein